MAWGRGLSCDRSAVTPQAGCPQAGHPQAFVLSQPWRLACRGQGAKGPAFPFPKPWVCRPAPLSVLRQYSLCLCQACVLISFASETPVSFRSDPP